VGLLAGAGGGLVQVLAVAARAAVERRVPDAVDPLAAVGSAVGRRGDLGVVSRHRLREGRAPGGEGEVPGRPLERGGALEAEGGAVRGDAGGELLPEGGGALGGERGVGRRGPRGGAGEEPGLGPEVPEGETAGRAAQVLDGGGEGALDLLARPGEGEVARLGGERRPEEVGGEPVLGAAGEEEQGGDRGGDLPAPPSLGRGDLVLVALVAHRSP
jgi:hypothetical protein